MTNAPSIAAVPPVSGRFVVSAAGGLTWDELRKRAHARLAERVDPVRNKHKPISILRQESRRTLEQYLDAEFPYLSIPERVRLIDDVLGEAIGLGPLEELFRDDAVREVLVLAPNQIIARRGETWLPTSLSFRDAAHLRATVARAIEQGEPVVPGESRAAIDVRLANGFRAVTVLPPDILDVEPVIAFARLAPAGASSVISTPTPRAGGGSAYQSPTAGSGVVPTAAPRGGSGLVGTPAPRSATGLLAGSGPRSGTGLLGGPSSTGNAIPSSSLIGTPAPRRPSDGPVSGVGTDPYAKIRGRITQRLIAKIAAAGIYDIQQIPKSEMQRIVLTMVEEANATDRLGLGAAEASRLTLEILTGMQA
jgi:pilus assembly protein CpaF